jgi:ribosomal protein S18 acetylase RimI-like enzyme
MAGTEVGSMTVTLVPMSEQVYRAWYDEAVRGYADDHARTGQVPADKAEELARGQFAELLPDGRATPGQHLFEIVDAQTETTVGVIWIGERPGEAGYAFIYDLLVFPDYRRRGYARAAMLAAEAVARGLGCTQIGLHVFGHNQGAIRLYQSLGYETTNLLMKKAIPPVSPSSR